MTPNMLKQWMDLADKEGIFDAYRQPYNPNAYSYGGGQSPVTFNLPGMKAEWAMRMMAQEGEGGRNFFDNPQESKPMEYVQPERFQGNYLSQLLKGR